MRVRYYIMCIHLILRYERKTNKEKTFIPNTQNKSGLI